MLGYFCPNVLLRKPEQWYLTMRTIQSRELGGNGVNKRSPILSLFIHIAAPPCNIFQYISCEEEHH